MANLDRNRAEKLMLEMGVEALIFFLVKALFMPLG